jgi:hypothetical protein
MAFSIPARIEGARLTAGLVGLGIAAVPSPRVKNARNRLHDLAAVIERDRLLRPVAACRVLPFSCTEEPGRWRIGGRALPGTSLERLAGATDVAVVFATIGAAWSDAISAYFQCGDTLGGYLLDEIGVAVLGRWTRRIEALIRMSARRSGQRAGSPIEPGHPDLPLTVQPTLAELAECGSVGITLTSGGMLAPVKSISMLIGIGSGLPRWSQAAACRRCPSAAKCRRQGRRSRNGA